MTNRKIFTREEIEAMSQKEFEKNEKAIMEQMNSIGIPSSQELITGQKNIPDNFDEKIQALVGFMKKHTEKVSEEQAIKDFQKGMNILNKVKNNSPIKSKQPLKEDGDLGAKSYACLAYACKHYPLRIIKKYIRRGAINNAIFDTKNDSRVNTEKKVNEVYNDLVIERRI